MPDVIQLLPDSIANQIAAGEVVQRPSSVVKELIENAIDAEASHIQVIIKDSGKTLVQITDDGKGMSITDARMCFERHATSKLTSSEDLFHIKTMGFRGEALASIAAVAQVELKSRRDEDETGTSIVIEGSKVKKQEPVACQQGTSISVKNLFYNIPARRNFLKSNPVEMRHIIDEFQRAALGNPEIDFSLYQNDMEVYKLSAGKLSKRIINIFGNNYKEQLVSCQEETPHMGIMGYTGKPEYAKKTRGEQFLFVNKRYIRSNYLNHAISQAYEGLMTTDAHPFYVLFLEIDPTDIDVNVHPTKTEIKFIDERTIYGLIKAAVKQALGVHNVTPTLDFNSDINTNLEKDIKPDQHSSLYRENYLDGLHKDERESSNIKNWEQLYNPEKEISDLKIDELLRSGTGHSPEPIKFQSDLNQQGQADLTGSQPKAQVFQVHQAYILSQVKSGLMFIDQQAAHQRILYERYLLSLTENKESSQRLLFPQTLELNPADFSLVMEIRDEIKALGFEFEAFGNQAVIINGIPVGIEGHDEKTIFENLIEQFKFYKKELSLEVKENLARSLALHSSIRRGKVLLEIEMVSLIDQLFGCKNPNYSPVGEKAYFIFSFEEIIKSFNRQN